jgi:hypothetical protein
MDDTPSNENPAPSEPGLNKIDLTQLQSFSFGTQWMQDKSAPRDPTRDNDRPRREDRREGGPAGADRRDRRVFRKPQGAGGPANEAGAPTGDRPPAATPREGGAGGEYRERGEFRGGPRREFRGGGPRRDGPGGGERGEFRGPRFGHSGPQERMPYDSPYFTVTFYPEDTSFTTLAKTIRSSCRTFELFEVARTVIGKTERYVVVLQRKAPAAPAPQAAPSEPATGGEAGAAVPAVPGVKPAPLYISVPDGVPCETEDAAIANVLQRHIGQFFDIAEVEVDPPKGNYQIINRCGITGELLAPPNYHLYNQIVQQHFAKRVQRMPFDLFRAKIESVRDPEVVNQWLQKMRKVTRYTWKTSAPVAPAAPIAEGETPPAVEAPPAFDSLEEARSHLLTHVREKVVRIAESARFHGRVVELIPPGEIRRAIEGALERQRRFPLDTANALRGRLRREGFTIFKKGSKGISYVCAVKRKFRVPGQVFADSINTVISFIEAHPMVKAGELPTKLLGIAMPKPVENKPAAPTATPAAVPPPSATESQPVPEAPPAATTADSVPTVAPAPAAQLAEVAAPAPAATPAPAAPPAPAPELTPEQREKVSRLQGDLTWLVHEGYVTEFIDGRLFAPPPMVEARKKEVESSEHDPENFPEAQTEQPAASSPETPPASVESSPVEATPVTPEPPAAPAAETPPASVESSPVEAPPVADQPVVPTEIPAVEEKTSGDTPLPAI